jgi:hypothetical protein
LPDYSKLLFGATFLSMLAACGSGGGDAAATTNAAPASIGTAGVFDVNYGLFTGVYTMLDDGRFYGIHFVNSGSTLAGHPHGLLSSTNSTSSREPIAWANFVDDVDQVGAQEAAGVFGRTFVPSALNVSITGSMGSFTATSTQQKTWGGSDTHTLYGDAIPMATLAGAYSGFVRTVGISRGQQVIGSLQIGADGTLAITATGCDFAGTITPHGNTGVFDVHVLASGTDCSFTAALNGIVTPLSFIGNVPNLAIQLDTDDNVQTAVFVVTKQ